jgi:hypothetical protein
MCWRCRRLHSILRESSRVKNKKIIIAGYNMPEYEIEYVDIKHEIHPTIRMEIKQFENYNELIFDKYSIYIYPNDDRARFRWTLHGPNTLIDDDSVRNEQIILIHSISSVLEYIKQYYNYINTVEIWGDSGYYEFAMFDYEKYDNFREYYYYNLALFGETWFEKYFKAEIPCSDYERIKSSLFLDPNFKNKSWDSFKCKYHIHNDVLEHFYGTTSTMRDFFIKIRENYSSIEMCRLIAQWIKWYLDEYYGTTLQSLSMNTNIIIKKQEKYSVIFNKI